MTDAQIRKYEEWPNQIKSIIKEHKKRVEKLSANSQTRISSDESTILSKVLIDDANRKLAQFLNIDAANASAQDAFLLQGLPQLLVVLTQGNVILSEDVGLSKISEDRKDLTRELELRTARVMRNRKVDPKQWPLVIQICGSILGQWSVADTNLQKRSVMIALITQVSASVLGTLWDSSLFPFISVVCLGLSMVVTLYIELNTPGGEGLLSCFCGSTQ